MPAAIGPQPYCLRCAHAHHGIYVQFCRNCGRQIGEIRLRRKKPLVHIFSQEELDQREEVTSTACTVALVE